jgi:hypothetical protein
MLSGLRKNRLLQNAYLESGQGRWAASNYKPAV